MLDVGTTSPGRPRSVRSVAEAACTALAICLVVAAAAQGLANSWDHVQGEEADWLTNDSLSISLELSSLTRGDQLVITDGPFIAGLANRDTPPSLVDTSWLRVNARYI